MLTDEVLFLLSQISQVAGRRTSPDLAGGYNSTFGDLSTRGNNGEALNRSSLANGGTHAYIGETFQSASIQSGVGSNIHIVANDNLIPSLSV